MSANSTFISACGRERFVAGPAKPKLSAEYPRPNLLYTYGLFFVFGWPNIVDDASPVLPWRVRSLATSSALIPRLTP